MRCGWRWEMIVGVVRMKMLVSMSMGMCMTARLGNGERMRMGMETVVEVVADSVR